MTIEEIRDFLLKLGAPPADALAMAQQLDKRARQMQTERGQSYEEALGHLIGMLKQGWAAKERGLS
jgi:hypothetical protein